ncbi:hypothetical protein ZWY2020_045463 [Hordeum vulgare]|nr:hypothetical protein ZWY2020_045463 [Hordeum vulgare]
MDKQQPLSNPTAATVPAWPRAFHRTACVLSPLSSSVPDVTPPLFAVPDVLSDSHVSGSVRRVDLHRPLSGSIISGRHRVPPTNRRSKPLTTPSPSSTHQLSENTVGRLSLPLKKPLKMASQQQSRKDAASKREEGQGGVGLEEIGKFRAEAQQHSADAIRAAQERYNQNLQHGGGGGARGAVTVTQAPGATVVSYQEHKAIPEGAHQGRASAASNGYGANALAGGTTASSRGTELQHDTTLEEGRGHGTGHKEHKGSAAGTCAADDKQGKESAVRGTNEI